MTLFSDLVKSEATLLARKWFTEPTISSGYDYTVPTGAAFVRATAVGCGGQGENWGGGGAFVRKVAPVTPGENLKVYPGDTKTASTLGDSWLKRNDGTVICYADRGRGNGTGGQASLSVGDVKRDGAAGASGMGGAPGSDSSDYAGLTFGGTGMVQDPPGPFTPPDYGGGGKQLPVYDEFGTYLGATAYAAGTGVVVLEFFDADPGY